MVIALYDEIFGFVELVMVIALFGWRLGFVGLVKENISLDWTTSEAMYVLHYGVIV